MFDRLEAFEKSYERILPDIKKSIEENRMGKWSLRLQTKDGTAVCNQNITVEQISSSFDFGTNVLMLGSMGQREQEYRDTITDLCNLVTTTFCWNDTEYEPGKFRFDEGIKDVYRRPPVERVLKFATEKGLKMKGQPLVADSWYPEWASREKGELERQYINFMERVSERYDGKFQIFDVVNESNYCKKRTPHFPLLTDDSFDYVKWAMKTAGSIFSDKTVLERNEGTEVNSGAPAQKYYEQNRILLDEGIRLDAIGHQFHIFSGQQYIDLLFSPEFTPESLYESYNHMSSLGVPMYISEVTMPTFIEGMTEEEGEEIQARVLNVLYNLWFSIPSMQGIIYWNIKDGDAWKSETIGKGCLTDTFLRPKKSYCDLIHLVKKQWNTRFTDTTDQNGVISFKGYKGKYRITVCDGENADISVTVDLDTPASSQILTV